MSLEITAKLISLASVQTGEGKNGQPWIRQDFIVETEEQYPKKVCISAWGDSSKVIQAIKLQSLIKVSFSMESREFNGKWYTSVRALRIDVLNGGSNEGGQPSMQNQPVRTAEPVGDPMASEQEATDDLPF